MNSTTTQATETIETEIATILGHKGPSTWEHIAKTIANLDPRRKYLSDEERAREFRAEHVLGMMIRDGRVRRRHASDPTQDVCWLPW